MNASIQVTILAALRLLPLCLLPECELLQDLQRPGVTLDGVQLQGLTLQFDLRVSKPHGVPLPVAGLDQALASRGAAFLEGRSGGATTIPARGSEVVPLSARITFVQALQTLSGVKPGAVVPYEASLGISVDPPGMAALRLPIETGGSFPIPTVPSVSLASFRMLSGSGAGYALKGSLDGSTPFGPLNFPFETTGQTTFKR